jgi:2-polyprenyl-6-methoxyphenol hydroxylase-like FAD-dependent oxidoreductase
MRRVEICSYTGAPIRGFSLDVCPGGPHEARIVRRAALLGALRGAVPEQAIRYGCGVEAVRATPDGAHAGMHVTQRHTHSISQPAQALHARWLRILVNGMQCAAGAEVELSSGERLRCRAVVGAEGIKSRVGAAMGSRLAPARYAGEVYYRLGLMTPISFQYAQVVCSCMFCLPLQDLWLCSSLILSPL